MAVAETVASGFYSEMRSAIAVAATIAAVSAAGLVEDLAVAASEAVSAEVTLAVAAPAEDGKL